MSDQPNGLCSDRNERERNGILRQLTRSVVVDRAEGGVNDSVHPVWEPDPWEVSDAG